MRLKMILWVTIIHLAALPIAAQSKRKVIIDQDARGPATTDQQSMMVLLNSPQVETLGITIVSGDQWRDEEVAHTLRMLELIGRTDVTVYPGAVFPLINRLETIERWESLYGKVAYKGAWNRAATGDGVRGTFHGPYEVPNIVEGNPTTKAADEDAAHFIIRMVHKYPHEVTIYALRPGDVVTHYGGRTSEVLNTDAEGRLVLADAMAYALDKLDPAVLVDVATLTGAIKVALGQWMGGFFANDETPWPTPSTTPARPPGSRSGGSRSSPTTRTPSPLRSPTRTTRPAAPGRSPPRCSSSTSPATCPGRTSTSPRPATRRGIRSSGRRGPRGSAPVPCSPG